MEEGNQAKFEDSTLDSNEGEQDEEFKDILDTSKFEDEKHAEYEEYSAKNSHEFDELFWAWTK